MARGGGEGECNGELVVCEGESDEKRNTTQRIRGMARVNVAERGTAWLSAANPEWESAFENGIRECVTWKVGGAGGGWLAGWMVGWGLGRRSVAVLILGQVTRVGTIHRRRWGGSGAKGGRLEVSNAGWLARNTPPLSLPVYLPTYLPTYPAGLTQNITLQIG